MSDSVISIGKPYICKDENSVRLCADIDMNSSVKTLYFEVDEEYGEYLCAERADAFVVALLPEAMDINSDIRSAAPVSSMLYYQLNNYFIPIYSGEYTGQLHNIAIEAPTSSERLVGTEGGG